MTVIRSWGWMLSVLLGVALLSGCSGLPSAPSDERAWLTQTEEPETRRRARVRLELAAGYFEQGQTMVALDEINRALVIDPRFAAAHNLRGLILMGLNEPRLAEESFQQALRISPRDGDTWHNLGWFYCQQERFVQSAQAFDTALQSPAYASAARTWMVQGICQARAGQFHEAEASLSRAFQLDASNPITLYNLALLLHKRDDNERARFYLRRLNNTDLANADSLWLGVKIEHRLRNQDAVQQLGRQLVRRFPDSREANAFERGAFDE